MNDGERGLYILDQIDLAKSYISEESFDKAIRCLQEVLLITNEKERVYAQEYIRINKLLGLCYRKKNMTEKALSVLKRAEVYCKKQFFLTSDLSWKREMAICYVNEAIVYDSQKQYGEAIQIYQTAIEVFREIGDFENAIKAMLSLGFAYKNNSQSDKCKEIFSQAMEIIDHQSALESYIYLYETMLGDIFS